MFDSLFQLLFSYRPVIFQQGDFRFVPSAGAYIAAGVVVAAVVATFLTYRSARATSRSLHRLVLAGIRTAALVLVLFCLFRPVLVIKAAVPQQNFLGILIDDSRSMQIADWNDQARGRFAREQFSGPESAVLRTLADRFVLRTFRFSSTAARVASPDDLTFSGAQTKLGSALDGARQELSGLPLAGLVLVSDGADTTDAELGEALLALKAASVPVFTVGVGQPSLARDIQIDRVSAPRAALKGTSLMIDVVVTQSGYAGETVTLDVEDEGRIVGSQEVKLPIDGEPAAVRVRFTASDAGARVFRFRITPRPGELVTQNNQREALIDVHDRRVKILYFEGEPRFEMKFIRRAVADDKNLQLATLQRTADNKYLRLDVDNAEELIAGFPKTREELFAYTGLVLGSVEAGAFTGDQLRMIAEFVERRGGGLLVLGGGRSLSEGGYVGTPVADALPFVMERVASPGADPPPFMRVTVKPTRAGEAHALAQIAPTEASSLKRWSELPVLTSVNPIRSVKPGATVLLGGTDEQRRSQPILAYQRYGRGKALVFTPQDSWLWQMHASMPLEDMTHENFWRQLLRWLVDGVPGVVETHTLTERVEAGETVTLTAEVVDKAFVELNDARVVAQVVTPAGGTLDVPLQWTGERNGQYRGSFVAPELGMYAVKVAAAREGQKIGEGVAHVRAAPGDAEYFDPTMHAARLQRIADDTGGRFYTADQVASLPEDVKYTGRGVTTVEERDLWHMPIVLMLLVGLVCAEWGYRRAVGMA
ncbi:MAG TPA: glutamine amidotransferase [Vicinamibacterales bacterium]|nr:glutamine amidotransferase [Vicinamibacterales bacterium]